MTTVSFHMTNALRTRGLLQLWKAKLQPQSFTHLSLTNRILSQHICCTCARHSKDLFPVRQRSTFPQSRALELKMEDSQKEEHDLFNTVSVGEADGWLMIGQYNIFPWSISGVETCVVIKSEDIHIVFDLGVAVPDSVKAKDVFIT